MAAGQHRPAANPLILRGSARVGRFARLRGHRAYEEVLPTIRKTGGIVNLAGCKARVTARQYGSELHAAIWTQVSCRHTRKASARARRY